jgi:uncharacterized damage-inducible protein DinB
MRFDQDLYDRFHELHTDIARAIEGLPTEALDWVAGSEINSINVLVVHVIGSERYWIGDVALGDPSGRVREKEFEAKGLDGEELKKRLSVADEYARQGLARFSLADLEIVRKSPRNDKTFTVGWCLLHALEHSALHLGHIQLTRQLWEQAKK